MAVHGELGCGYLEGVYQNALAVEPRRRNIQFQRQVHLPVHYQGELVGHYRADLIIEDELLLELKAIKAITGSCEAQLLNYLKASGISVGLILNFGSKSLQFKRMARTRHVK